ncbi:MAG TPA: fibronectin type III domain-containing protein, partial [Solirubrobacteraceae bacterium]|nr:fibronectin type III domain-containing protein [Solirubrobacteraceae bacterium]
MSDSAGDTFTEVLHYKASDGTEMSVWTAPVSGGAGLRPTITATPTAKADVGVSALEYSGLSTVADATVVDQSAHASGTTSGAATVSSGATPATTAGNELAVGFYADSGFGDTIGAGAGWTSRVNISKTGDMELLAEDQAAASGATPNATATSTAKTTWLMAAIVFKAASQAPPTVPGQPTGVTATGANNSAQVSWNAPSNGGSGIISYTITPFTSSGAQTATTITGTPPVTTANITGLTNGTAYTFTVTATNGIGSGSPSAASNQVTPSVPPPGPVIDPSTPAPAGLANNISTVSSNSFSPPAGSVIYAAFAIDSDPTGPANPHVVSVTNSGTALTWYLKGSANQTGSGVGGYVEVWWAYNPAAQANITLSANLSEPTKNVTPPIGMLQPVVVTGAAADQTSAAWGEGADTGAGSLPTATLTTTAPNSLVLAVANNWDSSVAPTTPSDQTTSLAGQSSVVLNPTDRDTYWTQTKTATTLNPSSVTMNDTAPSVRYHMVAWEVLAAPSGPPTAPAAPTGVTATAGNGSATVSWTAPSSGGSPITKYTITPSTSAGPQTPTTVTGTPPATNANVTGLTNGTAYTFTVTATNAIGDGPPSSASTPVTPSAPAGGQWGALLNWPMTAIHSILLDTGNVLQFDGWQQPEPTQVWNPSTQTFTTQTAPDSIFCSGMAELPDGRVLVVGGWGGLSTGNLGIVDTNIFDPATSTWTRVADMHYPRWYPDLTELANGTYVAISGNTTNSNSWADTPEVYDPSTNTWTVLTGVSTSQVHEEEYPFSYLAPNGNVFTIGPSEDQSFFLNVAAKTWTQVGGSSGVHNGSSVMYRPGQILYSGGAPSVTTSSSPAQATTAVIDLTAATPTWKQTAPMNYSRIYHTLTMLADGTVLAVGGEPTAGQTGQTEVSGGVLPSEIWDPSTQAWTTVASTGVTRGYHSTAVLMPDATVLVAGSGHANPGYAAQTTAQIYSPPYLFKGARPTISSAPATATYGSNFSISTPDASSISAVNLVSLGSDTHQMDMGQHFVPLSFTKGSGTLTVTAPASAALAPPNNYMIFIVNSNGVPSVASFVNLAANPPTSPSAPTGVTATGANASATVSWTPPADGGSPITGYTITPYVGTTAMPATTITGTPPASSATITGLANGTTYTFTVTATNAVGTSQPSTASNAVTPAVPTAPVFVQQVSGHAGGVSSLVLTPSAALGSGNRLVVQTGVWSGAGATMGSV